MLDNELSERLSDSVAATILVNFVELIIRQVEFVFGLAVWAKSFSRSASIVCCNKWARQLTIIDLRVIMITIGSLINRVLLFVEF